jgi:imidazoleglycerol-phosphate dehydratase
MSERKAEVSRRTRETDIELSINLDGTAKRDIITGVGFFDHMLDQVGKHGAFDIHIRAQGDLHIDEHHLVEDTGITLGQAFAQAVGDKAGIRRYGWAAVPLDEALVLVSLDLSGRGLLTADLGKLDSRVGTFPTELVPEFFRGFASAAGITLHVRKMCGENSHHIIEAAFKAFARALRDAVSADDRLTDIPSTKGVL